MLRLTEIKLPVGHPEGDIRDAIVKRLDIPAEKLVRYEVFKRGTDARKKSRILFTYIHRGVLDGSVPFSGTEHLVRTLARAGERWTFGLDPADLPAYLGNRGFNLIEDLGAADYRARYLGTSADRLKGYEFYRAALAEKRAG